MEGNLLDLVIIAVLFLSLIHGYRRGFIGVVAGIVSTVTGLLIAFLYRNVAADYLQAQFGMISDLTAFLEKRLLGTAGVDAPSGWIASLPMVQNGLAALHRQISDFAYLLVAAGCFLVLYVVSSQLIGLICLLVEKLLPRWILGGINKPGGILVLMAQNILIMVALAGILAGPVDLAAKMGIKVAAPAARLMQGSVLLPYLLDGYKWLQDFLQGIL
jgi:uncharacterized membrane protein required for colicin V production